MSEQELIQAARGVVEAFNASDWNGYRARVTADSVYDEVGTSRCLEGVEDIIRAMQGWKEAMPDVKGTVNNAQTGPLQGPGGIVEPTGKKQETRSGWVMSFQDGKLKESRNYFDMLSFLQQLGVMSRGARA